MDGQVFTILWVEDKKAVVNRELKAAKKFLNDLGFELAYIYDEDGTNIREHLSTNNLDLIITDYNITEKINGLDVIKIAREMNLPVDILFYSGHADFDPEEMFSQTSHYGSIEICLKKAEIQEDIQKLIKKNIRRYSDIIFLRGFVISKVIDLELQINFFFEKYFEINKDKINEFHNFILENRQNAFGGKCEAIELILKNKGLQKNPDFKTLVSDLRGIGNKRNLLAHCRYDKTTNALVSMGEPKTFNKSQINKLLDDTRKTSAQIDELAKALFEKQAPVQT